jgi:hypothetical protein
LPKPYKNAKPVTRSDQQLVVEAAACLKRVISATASKVGLDELRDDVRAVFKRLAARADAIREATEDGSASYDPSEDAMGQADAWSPGLDVTDAGIVIRQGAA